MAIYNHLGYGAHLPSCPDPSTPSIPREEVGPSISWVWLHQRQGILNAADFHSTGAPLSRSFLHLCSGQWGPRKRQQLSRARDKPWPGLHKGTWTPSVMWPRIPIEKPLWWERQGFKSSPTDGQMFRGTRGLVEGLSEQTW